jgi:PAS domain S-box-containing protein
MSADTPTPAQSTVLIIDDTPTSLAVMVEFLEAQDLRVLTAQDGQEGLRRAELTRPDIILLDVVMPGLDGFEVARRLRQHPILRDTPIIFMTALTDPQEKIRGFEAGGVDYVTKPLQIDEVRARVITHLRLHAAQRQLLVKNADLEAEMALRAAATQAVEEQRAFLQQVIDMIPHYIFAADASGKLTLANTSLAELCQTSVDELIGTPSIEALGDPDRAERIFHEEREVLATRRDLTIPEELHTDRSGRERVLHILKRPLVGIDGNADQIVGIAMDITRRRKIEQELEKYRAGLEQQVADRTVELRDLNRVLRAEVEERLRAESEVRMLNIDLEARVAERTQQLRAAVEDLEGFSYSVSHDLRAPLRAIDNFSNILLNNHAEGLDEEGKRLFGVVRKNARTMSQLINDMLAFAKAGQRDLVLEEVDIAAVAKDVWHELLGGIIGRQIQLQIATLPRMRADVAAIRVVLSNLLHNAVKFTRYREVAQIEIGGYLGSGAAVCFVKDNGAGFDPQYSHKLYGVFQRLHHTSEFEGTGIGLGVVKRIIDKHGGRVWAEGVPDQGATFYFSLPSRVS